MDGLFFETSRFELTARGPRGLFGLSRDSRPRTRPCAVLLAPNIVAFAFALVPRPLRGQVKGAVMEGPCSVERRLLTGNLKWLHWLVVIRHLVLPVGLLTSFKVPSRIGGISAPPQGTLQQSTRLSRGLGGLGRFPEKACFLVPGRASMDHRQNQNPGMGRGGGAFHSMARRRPTDSRPPLPPVASDQRPPLPTAHRPPPTTHSTHRSPGTLHCTTGWYLTQRPPSQPAPSSS